MELKGSKITALKPKAPKAKAYDPNEFPSPLAPPVLLAILEPSTPAGSLAAKSLVNAIMANSEQPPIGDVLKVTKERFPSYTKNSMVGEYLQLVTPNEAIVLETQLFPLALSPAALFWYSRLALSSVLGPDGPEPKDPQEFPRLISIGVYDSELKSRWREFHEYGEISVNEKPSEASARATRIHSIFLPRFKEFPSNVTNPLYLWMKGITTAHERKISLRAVVSQDKNLVNYRSTKVYRLLRKLHYSVYRLLRNSVSLPD
ncbi:MAG: hypothetical protein LBS60_02225 [Deltaproteobacteria bacterium]|nr:hypothetical protein [Deltaproteobacteria bacterium]